MHIADIELGVLGATASSARDRRSAAARRCARKIRGSGQVDGRVLRRRRGQPGRLPRGAQSRRRVAAADRLHVREQPVRAVDRDGARRRAVESIVARAAAYGMPGETADGNDVVDDVRRVAGAAIERARARRRADADRGRHLPLHAARDAHEPQGASRPRRGRGVGAPRPDVARCESVLTRAGRRRPRPCRPCEARSTPIWRTRSAARRPSRSLDEAELASFVYARSARDYPAPAAAERATRLLRRRERGAPARDGGATRASSSWARTSAGIGGIFRATEGLWEQFGGDARARHADLRGGFGGLARRRGAQRHCARSSSCRSSTS